MQNWTNVFRRQKSARLDKFGAKLDNSHNFLTVSTFASWTITILLTMSIFLFSSAYLLEIISFKLSIFLWSCLFSVKEFLKFIIFAISGFIGFTNLFFLLKWLSTMGFPNHLSIYWSTGRLFSNQVVNSLVSVVASFKAAWASQSLKSTGLSQHLIFV